MNFVANQHVVVYVAVKRVDLLYLIIKIMYVLHLLVVPLKNVVVIIVQVQYVLLLDGQLLHQAEHVLVIFVKKVNVV